MSRPRFAALLLALVTLAVYLPVARDGFILYDDGDYVSQNKIVQSGLTLAGIKWAFTTFHSANWHPLTWLSLMADCELFGLNAGGFHCVNVLFHAANAVLLFVLLLRLTAKLWPSAFVAALFALHPLHVESVAWISERKDVLSAFFGLLALLCYTRFVEESKVQSPKSKIFYILALLMFALGLMCKPMLVTWPFVMLLLDFWPLKRISNSEFQISNFTPLLLEKIPFFALTIVSCAVTYWAQSHGAVKSLAAVPLNYRLENAPVAVATYLLKMFWPTRLAIIYPMPQSISTMAFIFSTTVLVLITAAVWLTRKRNPFLPVGWFWFLGTLVPVLGLVKVGDAAMADRYTYVPSIGIFIAVAFGAEKILTKFPALEKKFTAAAIFILVALTFLTERQLQFWHDDESLFGHAVQVTTNNADALINYGVALENKGRPIEAMEKYREAEEIAPSSHQAYADLGNLLYDIGKPDEALAQFREAVKLKPKLPALRDDLGDALAELGHFADATNEFHEAMRLDPTNPAPHLHLGIALAEKNYFREATNEFVEAMRLDPANPSPHMELAKAFLQQGRDADAIGELDKALQLNPDNFQNLACTAHVLAADENYEIRDGQTALALATKANSLTDGAQPLVLDALGMACAETGHFDDAQEAARNAIRLAIAAGMKKETIAAMQRRLQLYEKHQPWRESFLLTNAPEKKFREN